MGNWFGFITQLKYEDAKEILAHEFDDTQCPLMGLVSFHYLILGMTHSQSNNILFLFLGMLILLKVLSNS